jgi:hypothetical protein
MSYGLWPDATDRTFAEPLVQSRGGRPSSTGEPFECLWRPIVASRESFRRSAPKIGTFTSLEGADLTVYDDPFDV